MRRPTPIGDDCSYTTATENTPKTRLDPSNTTLPRHATIQHPTPPTQGVKVTIDTISPLTKRIE